MGARSLELRATTSLGRLLRDRGERAEARRLVGRSYECFSEGLDTADLRRAKNFLDGVA
jgi:adenylate cyclase